MKASCGENQWLYGTQDVGARVKLGLYQLYIKPWNFFCEVAVIFRCLLYFSHEIWGQMKIQYSYFKILTA